MMPSAKQSFSLSHERTRKFFEKDGASEWVRGVPLTQRFYDNSGDQAGSDA
jgi:hypothetical protein